MTRHSRAGTRVARFDADGDGTATDADRGIWVHDLEKTFYGDSNLDGRFEARDLVTVFKAGQYEDRGRRNSTRATGDWNGDGDFDSKDVVLAFQDDGYEQSQLAVPEPTSWNMLVVVFALRTKKKKGQASLSEGLVLARFSSPTRHVDKYHLVETSTLWKRNL